MAAIGVNQFSQKTVNSGPGSFGGQGDLSNIHDFCRSVMQNLSFKVTFYLFLFVVKALGF